MTALPVNAPTETGSDVSVVGPAGCPSDDCDKSVLVHTDIFCHSHERFMPLRNVPGPVRAGLLIVACGLICWMFLLSAQLQSPIPVFLAAATVGGAAFMLPLRFSPTALVTTTAIWVGLCLVFLIAWPTQPGRLYAFVGTTLLFGTGIVWALLIGVSAFDESAHPVPIRVKEVTALVTAMLSVSMAIVVLCLVTWLPGINSFVLVSPGLRAGLMAVAGWVAVASIVLAIAAAALTNVGKLARTLVPQPHRPRRLPRLRPRVKAARRGPQDMISRMGAIVLDLAAQFGRAVVQMILALLDMFIYAVYLLVLGVVAFLNWLVSWVVGFYRIIIIRAVLVFRKLVGETFRAVVVPPVGLAIGSWLCTWFAEHTMRYLMVGGMADLALLLGSGLGAILALAVVWVAACDLALRSAIASASRSAIPSGAMALLVMAIGGWTIGLFGLLGDGPITVGWLTLSASGVLLGISGLAYARSRRGTAVEQAP